MKIQVTNDQATFILNLLEDKLLVILSKIKNREALELPSEEADQLYQDKATIYSLVEMFNI